jgi:arylsulfatase A-like enzyme
MNEEQKTAWGLSWKPQNEAFSRESPQGESVSVWMFQRFIKNYLRCLYAMDENIGRLIDSMDSNVEEGYNFIYTSERGDLPVNSDGLAANGCMNQALVFPWYLQTFEGLNTPVFKTEEIFRDFDLYSLIKNLGKSITNGPSQTIPQS